MSTERKNYPAIDVAKFLCALVILFYHYFSEHGPVIWFLEEALSLYAVAVALFMALSGFLLFSKLGSVSDRHAQWLVVCGQLKRILTIYALWSIPYLIFRVYTWDWADISIDFVLSELQAWIFQSTFYTIWFMPALALGILLAYFLYVHLPWGIVCLLAAGAYVLGAMQMTYSFAGNQIPAFGTFAEFSATWLQGARGGIFFGMPLVILGGVAARMRWRNWVATATLSLLAMFGLLAEALTLRCLIGGCGLDLAVMMLPAVFCITLFLTSVSWVPKYKAVYCWMRSMSILIFMSQRLFLTVIPWFLTEQQKHTLFSNSYVGALFVGGATLVFSGVLIVLSDRWNRLKLLY